MARQHLPRVVMRRPVALLFLFIPAEPRLVTVHVPGPGDPFLLSAGRDRTWHSSAYPVRHGRHVGVLRVPRYPDIPGLETFAGPSFRSARWDHSVSLPDKRIGLIGTGSTGVQTSAELGGKVRGLKIFQRTAQWVMPAPNGRYSRFTKAAMRRWPVLNRLRYRFWQWDIA